MSRDAGWLGQVGTFHGDSAVEPFSGANEVAVIELLRWR